MPKKRIHKDRSTSTGIGPKTRNRVERKCMLHCNSSKWMDPRTFEKHQQKMERFQAITSEPQSAFQLRSTMNSLIDAGSSSTSKGRSEREAEEESQDLSSSRHSDDDESNQTDDQESINILVKRKRYHKFCQTESIPDGKNLDDVNNGFDSEKDFTNLIQKVMIVVLVWMMSQLNNLLLPILMILILNQMMNIPI